MLSLLIDVTKCTGCETCVAACISENKLDNTRAEQDRVLKGTALTANRWCTIEQVADGRFARKSCMHCAEPSCVSACLVGAITKTPQGQVVYDADKCIGCRYCMLACPFHVPTYQWSKTNPIIQKCNFCFERTQQNKEPACAESCPSDVIEFGERDALLAKARNRIQDNKDKYIPHIWGETEFGGTSMLYISDVDLNALHYPDSSTQAIPTLTEPLIHKTPHIGLTVFAGLSGLSWIVNRRNKLMNEPSKKEKSEKENHDE